MTKDFNLLSLIEKGSLAILPDSDNLQLTRQTLWEDHLGFYQTPISFDFLAQMARANSTHESALDYKSSKIAAGYYPAVTNRFYLPPPLSKGSLKYKALFEIDPQEAQERAARAYHIRHKSHMAQFYQFLPKSDLVAVAWDRVCYGNHFIKKINNAFGEVLRLEHRQARLMRRLKPNNQYCRIHQNQIAKKYRKGEIIHGKTAATESTIYGLPAYLGGILEILLNRAAKKLRKRFYENGAHLGGILATNLPVKDVDPKSGKSTQEEQFRETIEGGKGPGNGKMLLLNFRGMNKDIDKVIQLIQFGDILSKDEFKSTSEVTRDDILAMHRILPDVMGIVSSNKAPQNLEKVLKFTHEDSIKPHQEQIEESINQQLPPERHIAFLPFDEY